MFFFLLGNVVIAYQINFVKKLNQITNRYLLQKKKEKLLMEAFCKLLGATNDPLF